MVYQVTQSLDQSPHFTRGQIAPKCRRFKYSNPPPFGLEKLIEGTMGPFIPFVVSYCKAPLTANRISSTFGTLKEVRNDIFSLL